MEKTKICNTCWDEFPVSNFWGKPPDYGPDCKPCAREKQQVKREKRYIIIRKIKEANPCADCKTFYPYYVMQFDHRPEFKKSDIVSQMKNGSLFLLKLEIAKCDIICANCHAIRSFKRKFPNGPITRLV